MICSGCGFDAPADFAFCPKCGRKLEREPEADRRIVTVLFADLSGFTALAERLDPEDVRAFQTDLFQEMAAAIQQYDGFVEKFVGDAVMAIFGAPVAHEDDPERALRAALAMQERMAGLNGRWQARLGKALALHVGVNTGPVVAGSIGADKGGAYGVTGDTVNTASRLQSAAPPGQVLASAATWRLAQHTFAFEPAGDLQVKGKSEPVAAYRLAGLLAAPRSARGLEAHGLVAPLVGRDAELTRLLAAFDTMLQGRAQVVSLIGEAGVGKSRLLREFFQALDARGRLRGVTVRQAACSALGERTYGVVAEFLRQAYEVSPEDPLELARKKLVAGLTALGAREDEIAGIAPLLGRLLGLEPTPETAQVEPEQVKRQIYLASRLLLEWRLRQGPLALIVEDLHWADAASVELLGFMVDQLADRPLMLLVTRRAAPDGESLAPERATHTVLRLESLPASQTEALLGALFGRSAAGIPVRLRDLIVQRAGGVPFYVEEIVRGLIASGALIQDDAGWTCREDAAAVDVPPTLQGLLLSRVDRLPPPARRTLQEAAVLGTDFDERLLRQVVSELEAADASLKVLCEAELLQAGAERQYRFSHALVQEVVYQNLLLRRRTELHGCAGLALEVLTGGRPERLEDLEALGHHWSLSADKAKGARYLVAAGDWARAIYANEDALRHYRRALATLAECDGCDPERLDIHERLGDLLGPTGGRPEALEHFEAALAGHAENRPVQARLHRKIGGLHWEAGDRARALTGFETGLALLDGQPEDVELARLYQEMGRAAFRSGDNPGAIEWAERALAHAERLAASGDPATRKEAAAAIAHARNTLGIALARTGRLEAAAAQIERSVAAAEAEELLQPACRGYTNLSVLYGTLDPGRAIETCQRGFAIARKIGDLGLQARLHANLAVAYCALTNRCEEQGMGAAQAAIELDRRLGQLDHLAIPLIVLGQIYQCHGGDPAEARRCYEEALTLAEPAGDPQLLFPCYDGLGTLYLDQGDEARAEQYMQKAQEVCERAGIDPDSLVVLPFLE
ncbi:MAG TPA: adenylate/guanylate cyclase domain-containing protein [Methylomirabilota bacterium]|nr:adenylate/guanylate cyclase domain-containing protein [Methylomirabilota bacterium]